MRNSVSLHKVIESFLISCLDLSFGRFRCTLNVRNYKIQVHTLPEVIKEDVKIVAGQHNHIPIETPQGTIELKLSEGKMRELKFIVREEDECDVKFRKIIKDLESKISLLHINNHNRIFNLVFLVCIMLLVCVTMALPCMGERCGLHLCSGGNCSGST